MDYTIGTELEPETLVLTRGRDFRWNRENPAGGDYPAGDLFIELDTRGEHNALQQVEVDASSGGSYKISHSGNLTSAIDYYDPTSNPLSLAEVAQSALEALPSIGAGNVLVHPAQFTPVWELRLTLDAGHNEVQLITFTSAPANGIWKLAHGSAVTIGLPWNATAAQVQSALEALPTIGLGNVTVTGDATTGYRVEFIGLRANTNVGQLVGYSTGQDLTAVGWLFGIFAPLVPGAYAPTPSVAQVRTLIEGQPRFKQPLVDTVILATKNLFGSFGTLSGVNVDLTVEDPQNAMIRVTGLQSYTESGLLAFAADVTPQAVEGAMNNAAGLSGVFDTVTVDFYWNHQYQVEFVGALALTPQLVMGFDQSALTGVRNQEKVSVTVLKPGRARFTKWPFVVSGSTATLKVESEETDQIIPRTPWQLVFMPEGEASGGDPLALGRVVVQGLK